MHEPHELVRCLGIAKSTARLDVGDAVAFGVAPAGGWCVGQVDTEAVCGGQPGAFADEDGNLFRAKQFTDFVAQGNAGLFGDDQRCDLPACRPRARLCRPGDCTLGMSRQGPKERPASANDLREQLAACRAASGWTNDRAAQWWASNRHQLCSGGTGAIESSAFVAYHLKVTRIVG